MAYSSIQVFVNSESKSFQQKRIRIKPATANIKELGFYPNQMGRLSQYQLDKFDAYINFLNIIKLSQRDNFSRVILGKNCLAERIMRYVRIGLEKELTDDLDIPYYGVFKECNTVVPICVLRHFGYGLFGGIFPNDDDEKKAFGVIAERSGIARESAKGWCRVLPLGNMESNILALRWMPMTTDVNNSIISQ